VAERRNNPVSVRLSGGERGALDALAAEHGVGASTMARTLIVQALAARSGLEGTGAADGVESPDTGEAGMRAVDLTWAREGVEAAVESALRRTLAPGLLVSADVADPVPGSGPRKVPRGYSYADHLPYDTPESLDELQGPTSGKVRVPPPIDTSLDPTYELSDPGQLRWLYTRVLREGNVAQQREYIDGKTLSRLWGELELPARCRAIWEAKFPMLRGSVVPR
jgi:hypothetical protein